MISLSILMAVTMVACQIDEAHRPTNPIIQPSRFNADSVQLLSACNAEFLVRNANDVSVVLAWDVEGTAKAGQLRLPARPRGKPYSEVALKTEAQGRTRLFYQGVLIESNESVGITCVARNEVPASAPDYYPAEILGLAPTMHDPDSPSLRYQRGIVTVVFVSGVSQLDRQLTIASIGAIVIGGVPGGAEEGEYILKLVADTSVRATKNAVAALRLNAKVRFAGPNLVASPMYRRPKDGLGWRAWKISLGGGASDSSNWALEDIAAPLAWGCETGTTSTKIALTDEYFFALADVNPNLNASASKGVGSFPSHADARAHGTRTMSVLAARGNNDIGMTGVAWAADVRAYDVRALGLVADTSFAATDLSITNAIFQAVTAGAQIVNISLGELWQLPGGGVERIPSAGAVAEVVATKERMQRTLDL